MLKSINNKKVFLGLLCLALAAVISFIVLPRLISQGKQTAKVYFAKEDITVDTALTEDLLIAKTIFLKGMPSDLIREREEKDIIGKKAKTPLLKDSPLRRSEIGDANGRGQSAPTYSLSSLNGKEGAVSLAFKDAADALSGKLKTGDIISIIASSKETTNAPAELNYVRVLGTDELSITILADKKQALKLASLEESARLKAYLVYRGSAENAEVFLEEQRRALK
jgi:pilus assembly protein CpaB